MTSFALQKTDLGLTRPRFSGSGQGGGSSPLSTPPPGSATDLCMGVGCLCAGKVGLEFYILSDCVTVVSTDKTGILYIGPSAAWASIGQRWSYRWYVETRKIMHDEFHSSGEIGLEIAR